MGKVKRKHSYFVSTLSISLVLFLLGAVAYLGFVVERSMGSVVDSIEISLLLREGTDQASYMALMEEARSYEKVETVSYTSKDQAAEKYKKMTGEDFSLFIDENPLPASINISFSIADDTTIEQIDAFTAKMSKSEYVEEVLHPKAVVDQVIGYVYKIKFILYAFFVALVSISVVLINNAIKLTIRSKRFLIKSMKLIGATDNFIRKPFIYEAARQGALASLIAVVLSSLLMLGVNRGVDEYVLSREELYPLVVIFIFVAIFGIIISMICTNVALSKQLNQNSQDLHTY